MGTDTLGSQSKKNEKDRSKGETKNTILGKGSPPATDAATAFQSDQQYPATANDPVAREYEERRKAGKQA
jgi:hypothetical protein